MFKHIWVKVSNTFKFQPNWSKNTLKSGFFRISGKSGSRIRNFFGLKPSRDQDGANKKKFSQIGPAVPEEIGHKQTRTQTSCCYIREIGLKARYKNGFGGNFSLLGWGRLPLKNRLLFFSIHSLIVDKSS